MTIRIQVDPDTAQTKVFFVLPDDIPPHPLAISREIVSLAPKAEGFPGRSHEQMK